MDDFELTPNQKQYLSWKIMGTALEVIDQELIFADLHPGGGQYDCLSLISPECKVVLMLNREGSSAVSDTAVVSDIWNRAMENGIHPVTMDMLVDLDIDTFDEEDKYIDNSDQVLVCKRMARWVQFQSEQKGVPICCWFDGPYGTGPQQEFLDQVRMPPSWTTQEPPYKSSDWSAWLFALTIDEKVVGMVNMKTGEAVNTDGTQMSQWYEKHFAYPKAVIQSPEEPSRSDESPTEEVIAIFRKLRLFNGYQVFGDQLAEIAETVSENWHDTGAFPDDLKKIQGALFLEFRRVHHSGDYPEGKDLLYIKALGEEIDKRSRG